MARTFLFLYVFTIPFVLLGDDSSDFVHCFIVFLLTYGFVGLETVAIELDDPFGDDLNDFDNGYVQNYATLVVPLGSRVSHLTY
jgi:predicted membrane chloride channel (bestrophin family)